MESFSSFFLLSIANDQSWKDPQQKHWKSAPWWSAWNVFPLWNSKKYVVTCLHENKNFFSFYNLVTSIAKQVNIFSKLTVICCFNYVFLCSLTLLIWSKSLSYLCWSRDFCKKIVSQICKWFIVYKSSFWIFTWTVEEGKKVLYLSV